MMPGSITVSANAAGLAPGTYTGTVIVALGRHGRPICHRGGDPDGGWRAEPGMVGIFPGALRFAYNVNAGTRRRRKPSG